MKSYVLGALIKVPGGTHCVSLPFACDPEHFEAVGEALAATLKLEVLFIEEVEHA